MRWKGRRQSRNIEDRRSSGGGGIGWGRGGGRIRLPRGGRGVRSARGGGMSGIIFLVIAFFALRACGIDPLAMLAGGSNPLAPDQGGGYTEQNRQASPRNDDEMKQFMATVLAETEQTWAGIFEAHGRRYEEPVLVLFNDQVRSACGFASAASGPFYCPGDRKVYIDLSFFNQLSRRFGASGDFAQAYVLAHEVGHHVQNLIGVLPRFNQMRRSMSKAQENQMSVRVELQADCFAGIWAHQTAQKGLLERGDLEEAIRAAHQIGDDTLQRQTQGYVVPESFNHGTSAQRKEWFSRGFQTGRLEACDTLNNPV